MNLIRLIKLKKLNGELDDLTEQESYFLSFFDGLKTTDGICYKHIDSTFFILDVKNKKLYYSYDFICTNFEIKYNINTLEIYNLINKILETKLKLSGFTSIESLF